MRGTGADIIVLEEAAYLDERVFFQVVAALLEMKWSCMFAISTPADEFNYYSKLVRLIDPKTGQTVFDVIHKTLVCDSCQKNGLGDSCQHMRSARPAWKNESTYLIELIMRTRKGDYDREIGAQITEAENSAFSPELMNELKNGPRFTGTIPGRPVVYIGIDASGDSVNPNSEFAMAASVYHETENVHLVRTVRERVCERKRERESVCVCLLLCVAADCDWERGSKQETVAYVRLGHVSKEPLATEVASVRVNALQRSLSLSLHENELAQGLKAVRAYPVRLDDHTVLNDDWCGPDLVEPDVLAEQRQDECDSCDDGTSRLRCLVNCISKVSGGIPSICILAKRGNGGIESVSWSKEDLVQRVLNTPPFLDVVPSVHHRGLDSDGSVFSDRKSPESWVPVRDSVVHSYHNIFDGSRAVFLPPLDLQLTDSTDSA